MTQDQQHEAAFQQLRQYGVVAHLDLDTTRLETYQYTLDAGGLVVWNVTLAKYWIAQGRSLGRQRVPRDEMRFVAETYDYDRAHVAQVDSTQPGICAPLLEDGQVVYIVIDGIHRLVRAYQLGQPFQVHVLSDTDARACVLTAPPGWIP